VDGVSSPFARQHHLSFFISLFILASSPLSERLEKAATEMNVDFLGLSLCLLGLAVEPHFIERNQFNEKIRKIKITNKFQFFPGVV